MREAIGMGGAMEGTTRCIRVVGALARAREEGVRVAKYRGARSRESCSSVRKEAVGEDWAEWRESAPGVAYQRTDTRVCHVVHGCLRPFEVRVSVAKSFVPMPRNSFMGFKKPI